jgi:hypothetical protein
MNTRGANAVSAVLDERLSSLRATVRSTAIAGGAASTLLLACVAMGGAFCLDSWIRMPQWLRIGLLLATASLVAITAILRIVIPFFRRPSPEELAAAVELMHPDLNERLLSTLELINAPDSESAQSSPLMREWLFKQTAASAQKVDFDDVVDSRPAFRRTCLAAVTVLLLLTPFFVWRDGYSTLWLRFFNPWGNYARGANLSFVVQPGNRTVPRGEDLEIVAIPQLRVGTGRPKSADLIWSNAEGRSEARTLRWDDARSGFVAMLPQLLQGFRYRIDSFDGTSPEYEIRVVERPAIAALTLDVQTPAYCGYPAQRIDGAVGEIRVFERSDLTFTMKFNRPIARARWLWIDEIRNRHESRLGTANANVAGDVIHSPSLPGIAIPMAESIPVELAGDGASAVLKMKADREGRFEILLWDDNDIQNRAEPTRALRLITDTAPIIAWNDGGDHPQAKSDDVVSFGVAAADDIGLAALELHYSVLPNRLSEGMLTVDASQLGKRDLATVFSLDLKKLLLPEGSLLAVKARAADERPVPGPNETWTTERIVTITREAQAYGANQLAARHQQIRDTFRALRQETMAREKDADNLKQKTREAQAKKEPLNFGELAEPLRDREAILNDKVEQFAATLADDGLMGQLTKPLEEVSEKDLQPAVEKVEQARTGAAPEQPQRLEESQNKLREADQRLAQIEQRFEELARMEKDLLELNRLADRTDRLADNVAGLEQKQADQQQNPEQTQQEDRQALEQDWKALQEEQQQLSQSLQDLLNRRPELLEAARANLLEKLKELADRANQLAQKEDLLAEAMKAAGQQNAQKLKEPAARQQALLDQEEKLAAENELEQGKRTTPPLDLEAAQKALRDLQQGNLEAAREAQLEAAEDLERLAAALEKNSQLPADPQAAARELMNRQQAVKDKLNQEAQTAQQKQQKQGFDPDAAAQPLKEELKDLAAEQAAIQAAATRLDVPQQNSWRQRDIANNANEALKNLLANAPQQAAEAAERSRQNLEALANELGSPEERQKRALDEAKNLRNFQEGLANHLDNLRNQNNSGQQSAEQLAPQLEQQINPQTEIAKKAADLDVPQAKAEQWHAVQDAAKALAAVQSKNPQDAAAAAQKSLQSLAELQRKLEGKPTLAAEVAQLQKQQQELGEKAKQALTEGKPEELAAQVEKQRQQAQAVQQFDSPSTRPIAETAARAAGDAANFLDQAKNNPQQKAEAEAALERAQAAVDQLAAALAPKQDNPAKQAEALSQQLANAAQAAKQTAEASETPLGSAASQAMERQTAAGRDLSRIPAGPAQAEKRDAAQAIQAATEAQQRVEQLARQQPSPNAAEPNAASPELNEAMEKNAVAQQAAANAAKRFADRLNQADVAPSQVAADQSAVENSVAAREPGLPDLQQLAKKAEELANLQKEAREKTQPLLDGIADQGQRNQKLNEARDAQNKVNGEMWQLARNAAPEARAAAQEHTQFASDALGWDKPERAAAEQQAAEDKLRELARQASNQAESLASAAKQAAQSPPGAENPNAPAEAAGQMAERARALAAAQRAAANGEAPPTAVAQNDGPLAQAAPMNAQQAADQQQAIAQQAQQLAEQAGKAAPNSEAAAQAEKFAQQAAQAAQQAGQGEMAAAQEQGSQAAQSGQQASDQLQQNPADKGGAQPALAQQAKDLSQQQQKLASRMAQMSEAPAGNPSAPPQNPESPKAAAEQGTNPQKAMAQQANSNPADQAAMQANPKGDQPGEPSAQSQSDQAREAVAKQQEIARQAAELAAQTTATAPESEAAQQANKFAEMVAKAAQQAAAGAFRKSSEEGQAAAQDGNKASDKLLDNPGTKGGAQPELAETAKSLADEQETTAKEMARLAESPAARNAAQSQGQNELQKETQSLSKSLSELSKQLKGHPVDRQQQGQQAEQAQQRSSTAARSMAQARDNAAQGNSESASQSAKQAANALRQAMSQAMKDLPQGSEKNANNPVPNGAANQVTDAQQQLQQAGQMLAQGAQQAHQGNPLKQPGQSPTETQSGQMAKDGAQPGSQQSEQGEKQDAPPSASQALKQGAESMRQAARDMQLRPGEGGQQQMASSEPGKPGQSHGNSRQASSHGANESARIVDMQSHLKNLSSRNWGQLPGTLQTEILQATRRRPDGDYARLIKMYFEDISRTQPNAPVPLEDETAN